MVFERNRPSYDDFNASLKFEDPIFVPTILKIFLRISTRAFLFRMYWSVEINKTHRNRVVSARTP